MRKYLSTLFFISSIVFGVYVSIVVMLLGGILDFVTAMLAPDVTFREWRMFGGLLQIIFGPFLGIIIIGFGANIADNIGKEK